ncbi:hypothetical protein [Thermus sp.]|uniref:hypothetical protein n=1 Tax=Thermus sp. TaxID=275 RepID=UPI00307FA86D
MRTWYRNTLFLGLFLLAACSGHTVYRFEVDLLSFLPPENRSGTLNVRAGSAEAPFPAQEGQPVSFPGGEALVDGRFLGEVELTNNTSGDLSGTLEVRVGPASDTDLFDGTGDVAWGSSSISLPSGQAGAFSLDLPLDSNTNPQVFALVQSGEFRIGARLSVNSTGTGQVAYTLKKLDLTLRLKPFNLIPDE